MDTPEKHFSFDQQGIIQYESEFGKRAINTFQLNRRKLVAKRKERIKYFQNQFREKFEEFIQHGYASRNGGDWIGGKLIYKVLFKKNFDELLKKGKENPLLQFISFDRIGIKADNHNLSQRI